jgi:nucleotide-binding universal stress UspA family protein
MRVLIATDGSPTSRIVQEEVAARPWPLGTVICVLNVVDPAAYPWPLPRLSLALKSAQEALQQAAELLSNNHGFSVSTLITEGHPAKSIVDVAEVWSADLIFMGSRGCGPIGRFLLGSTVSAVLHEAPCAVEIVRDWRSGQPSRSNGGLRILLATDGSICSQTAVESVAKRPWPAGSVVRVVSVPVFAEPRMETSYLDADAWEELRSGATAAANRSVDAALDQLRETALTANGTIPTGFEGPRACILDEADRWRADLIVAGSHGRRRLDRFLLGTVSEALALYAPCSVEVVREKHIRETKDSFRGKADDPVGLTEIVGGGV